MAGGGSETGATFLETPTYTLGLLLLIFLAGSTLVERGLNVFRGYLKKRKKVGLLAAVDAMCLELLLLGLISLILQIFADDISHICVPVRNWQPWIILDSVNGCPSCLKQTKHITPCFLTAHGCPLKEGSEAPECQGAQALAHPECGYKPGYQPVLSYIAIEEIHIFVFLMALVHIACGVVMVSIASLRLWLWQRWRNEDDRHAKAVRETLKNHEKQQAHLTPDGRICLPDASGKMVAYDPIVGLLLANDVVIDKDNAPGDKQTSGQAPGNSNAQLTEAAKQKLAAAAADNKISPADVRAVASANGIRPIPAEDSKGSADHQANMSGDLEQGQGSSTPARIPSVSTAHAKSQNTPPHSHRRLLPHLKMGNFGKSRRTAKKLPTSVEVTPEKPWHGRAVQLNRKRDVAWEYVVCFLRQFRPLVIDRREFQVMRASFILTHRVSKDKFDFMAYIYESMDDDFAHIVGMSTVLWFIIIIYVLVSGLIGWPASWFVVASIVIMLIVNTKLIQVIRYATRGGVVHRLQPNIFWFKRPWLLLPVIRGQLFLSSFLYMQYIFFAAMFGPDSCFFATSGFQTRSLPIPWWLILTLNSVVFLSISFVTLPAYSLAVQMGSDFKHHMLPPKVKARLLELAAKNKQKVKDRQAQEASENGFVNPFVKPSAAATVAGNALRELPQKMGDTLAELPHKAHQKISEYVDTVQDGPKRPDSISLDDDDVLYDMQHGK